MLTIGLSDIKGLAWNTGLAGGAELAGSALAFAIDRLAHKIFKVEEGTTASLVINTLSVASVLGLSFYLEPTICSLEIATFKGRKTFEIVATYLLVTVLVQTLCSFILPKPEIDYDSNTNEAIIPLWMRLANHPVVASLSKAPYGGTFLGYVGSKSMIVSQSMIVLRGIQGALQILRA
jgi:hypothetical protein